MFIPFYFNPAGGTLTNRAFVAAFEDRYAASGFSIGPVSVNLGAALLDATGNNFANGNLPVSGVAFTDLQTFAGGTPFTSSGKVLLGLNDPLPANANLLGLMSQSLGTFAVGQGMPGYFGDRGQGDRFVDNGDGTVTDRDGVAVGAEDDRRREWREPRRPARRRQPIYVEYPREPFQPGRDRVHQFPRRAEPWGDRRRRLCERRHHASGRLRGPLRLAAADDRGAQDHRRRHRAGVRRWNPLHQPDLRTDGHKVDLVSVDIRRGRSVHVDCELLDWRRAQFPQDG